MNLKVKTWSYKNCVIRQFWINGEAWFVAKDVSEMLDYKDDNGNLFPFRRFPDEKDRRFVSGTMSGIYYRKLLLVNERGLIDVLRRSRQPRVYEVRLWLENRVFPEIHGQEPKNNPVEPVPVKRLEAPATEEKKSVAVRPYDVTVWNYEGRTPIRQTLIDGEPWFVAKDVCGILGFTNSRKALADHVSHEDKNTVTIRYGNRGNPNATLINESGVNSLILGSRLPKAKEFKHWVTSVVLPSIRKTGAYVAPASRQQTIAEDEPGKKMIALETDPVVAGGETAGVLAVMVANLFTPNPNERTQFSPTMIARQYGRDAQWLNVTLAALHVQHKCSDGIWRLNETIARKGFLKDGAFTNQDGRLVHTSFWTDTGRQYIIALLKLHGINPISVA